MKQRRVLIFGASIAVLFVIWSFFQPSEDDLLQTRDIRGRITEIHQKTSNAHSKLGSTRPRPVVIAVVAINDAATTGNGHARILIRKGDFEVGDEVPLTLKLYRDGSRKVILNIDGHETADGLD
ncbi:MAG: hypothetical protein ACU84Q_09680 [Gammaproteobacteria bacterium]